MQCETNMNVALFSVCGFEKKITVITVRSKAFMPHVKTNMFKCISFGCAASWSQIKTY